MCSLFLPFMVFLLFIKILLKIMNKKLLIFSVIITIIYALFTLNTLFHHETWADEAQVWQLCKHLSLSQLIVHLQNEGHPVLFYLMVMPFAKVFNNIIFMQLICWGFMCLSVFLLMYFAPFKLYTKLAIILSAGFLYFFPVIARNYSIIPFLVFLAAILYYRTKQHPILYAFVLIFLANTHIIMFAFSLVLAFIFYWENIIKSIRNKNFDKIAIYILALLIMVLGFYAVLWELSNTTNNNVFLEINLNNTFNAVLRILILFFLNAYNYDIYINMSFPNAFLDIFLILIMILSYILCWIALSINNFKVFLIGFLSVLFQLTIYIIAYNSFVYVNRIFCAHLILLFCFWILFSNKEFNKKCCFFSEKIINILLFVFFALTIFNGINYTKLDLKYNYTGAKETAEYIKANISPDNSLILIDNEPYMVSLAYYLSDSHKLYSVFRKKYLDYVIWDKTVKTNYADLGWSQYVSYLKKQNPKKEYYVINSISDKKHVLEKTQTKYFKLIFKSGKMVEPYEGYRVFQYIGK